MSSSVITVAAAADAPVVAQVMTAGFVDDPVMQWAFGGDNLAGKLGAFFGLVVPEALVPMGATYLADGAAAGWTPPHPEEWPQERSARLQAVLEPLCTPADFRRTKALNDALGAARPAQPFWYLGVIATVPDRRGRGLGRALLERSLRPVDEAHLPAYLESSNPRNVTLYERHGFRATGTIDVADGPTLIPMWRESSSLV